MYSFHCVLKGLCHSVTSSGDVRSETVVLNSELEKTCERHRLLRSSEARNG
jgi:hypothetical protein